MNFALPFLSQFLTVSDFPRIHYYRKLNSFVVRIPFSVHLALLKFAKVVEFLLRQLIDSSAAGVACLKLPIIHSALSEVEIPDSLGVPSDPIANVKVPRFEPEHSVALWFVPMIDISGKKAVIVHVKIQSLYVRDGIFRFGKLEDAPWFKRLSLRWSSFLLKMSVLIFDYDFFDIDTWLRPNFGSRKTVAIFMRIYFIFLVNLSPEKIFLERLELPCWNLGIHRVSLL